MAAAVPISDAVAPRAPAKPALAEPAEGSAPEPVIPRALPPASYGGSAEVLALRALYDRAERDRVHLRNLAVILFGLWTATLVLLALAVFGDWGRRQPASGEAAQPTPTAATDEPAAAEAPAATPVEIQGAAPAYVGQEVTLSAEVPLEGATVRWTLIDRPEGSLAEVATDPEGRAVLRPDRPGAYTLAVVARDGQASTSATATIHAVANPEAPEAPRWQDVAAALLGRPLSGASRACSSRRPRPTGSI